ncbi:MAG: glycosyltransferase, partial [Proteobacteria bacterium]|nr:glycosyltransferase [Pseudomonadota bacterium]
SLPIMLGGKSLERLADLMPPHSIFTTFAELDHYGAREDAAYVGSIHGVAASKTIAWPEGAGDARRVLVYLRSDQRMTETVIGILAAMKAAVICAVPGAGKSLVDKYACTHLRIVPDPVHLRALLDRADVLIGYGSSGVIAESLLAGVPLLMIPQTVEQYLGARRVEAMGAGIILGQKRSRADIEMDLEKLLASPSYRLAAESLAGKYRSITPEHAADRATTMILAATTTDSQNRHTDSIPS